MTKDAANLPDFKDQVAPDQADRWPPRSRDPDGSLLAGDDAVRAALGSASLQAETVEPFSAGSNCNNNNLLGRGVSERINSPSTGTTAEYHPSVSTTSVIPIAFVVADADAGLTSPGNINSNDNNRNGVPAPTQSNRDPRQNRFVIIMLVPLALIAIAGVVVFGVCGSNGCDGGKREEGAPAASSGNTTSPVAAVHMPPVTTPSLSAADIAEPAPIPTSVAEPVSVFAATRAHNITRFIHLNSYIMGEDLLPTGISPEERALQWLIDDDPLQLNADEEDDKIRLLLRYSLLTLWFQSLDAGAKWIDSTDWLNEDECSWAGIGCELGVVTSVNLTKTGLQGTISPDLALLSDLTLLDLSFNNVSGPLPLEISLWTSVTHLDCSFNSLMGPLPSGIGLWTKLEFFSVLFNSLTGMLPSEIGLWTSLTYFDCSFNSLMGSLPSEIFSWVNLTDFHVTKNFLTGSLTSGIGLWTNLKSFAVPTNLLTGSLPSEIGLWTSLTVFDCSFNSFSGYLPTHIGLWPDLKLFYARGNSLKGSLPLEIGLWTHLELFEVYGNDLTGQIPEAISNWTFIEQALFSHQNFTGNSFTGSMPDGICEFISGQDILRADCELLCSCCTECL